MSEFTFFKNKHIFLTGHTGFKGAWLCRILTNMGAVLTGYALEPSTSPSLFDISRAALGMESIIGDVRDFEKLQAAFDGASPEIVIHMAAQPLVGESYKSPVYTYETNFMGTVNLLECIRLCKTVGSAVIVTTDKVYRNKEWEWGYREDDALGGFDPYSSSKSCAELAVQAYKNSFFGDGCPVSTARAGNVIGGGDFTEGRIIPDCIKAAANGNSIQIRNPASVRPYQHVIEPLFAYLMIAQKQYGDARYAGSYNIGPDDVDCVTTGELADMFCKEYDEGATWEHHSESVFHETSTLRLDSARLKKTFGWHPRWNVREAVARTVEWTKAYNEKQDVLGLMDRQINEYCLEVEKNNANKMSPGKESHND